MKQFYLKLLFLIAFNISFGKEIILPPMATITGGTTVCQNATNPVITFTGSGGTAPYIFTYTLSGVSGNQTISTTGTNNTVTLNAPTGSSGSFTYSLVSLTDSSIPPVTNNITGQTAIIVVSQQPDATINGTGSGTFFGGVPVFRICNNTVSTFSFTNGSATASTINTNYAIIWGDGTPNFSSSNWATPLTHTYQVGLWNLVYTIQSSNGCNVTKNYIVFVGSNPAVSLGNPGNTDICNSSSLTFPITGTTNNPPGTTYTVSFNDSSSPQVFNHPPPSSVTHNFLISSCGVTSSNGTTTFNNSFSANIVAENPCGVSAIGVVPIYVSSPPIANFILPVKGCTNTQICITNTSIGAYENNGSSTSCNTSPKFVWSITPNSGYTISSGSLGNDFSSTDPNIWTTGTSPLCINFTQAGNYTVTLKIGNRCGVETKTQIICIEPPLVPQFTLSATSGCAQLIVNVTNTTNLTGQCSTPTYIWDVTYANANCGTASGFTYINGTSPTSVNPSFSFTEAGIYSIKVTTTNSCGTVTSAIQTVTIKKPPTVAIAAISNFCGSATVNPVAIVPTCVNSSSMITYAWSFPGATPSTATTLNPGSINYSTSGNYIVSLVVTNECGVSNTATQNFTINISPTITNTSLSQTICSGSQSTAVLLTANPSGANFSWTAVATSGISGFVSSGTNTIPAQTLITTTTTGGTVTYSITPSIGNCSGTIVNYIITVNPAAQVNQPSSSVLCNGATSAALNFTTANPSGTTYSWTNSTPSIGLAASGSGSIPAFTAVNSTTSAIIATIVVTPSFSAGNATCSGATKTFTITVNPTGQVNQPNDIIKCPTENISIPFSTQNNSGATTYSWTNNNTAIGLSISGIGSLNFTATNTSTNPIFATITVIPTLNFGGINCNGNPVSFTITVNPSAQLIQPASIAICNGNSTLPVTFSTINSSGITTYAWTNSNSSIGLGTSGTGDIPSFAANNNTSAAVTATITVTPQILIGLTNCNGPIKQFTITILPNASVNPVTNKVICNSSTVPTIIFSSTNTGGTTTYSWTNSVSSIGLAASGNGNIPTFTATNTTSSPIISTITVTPSFTSGSLTCAGNPQTFTITVNPSAQVNPLTNIEVCNGNAIPSINFSTTYSGGTTTYSWTNSNTTIALVANGIGSIPAFTAFNSGSIPINATITVTPTFTNAGVSCTGLSQTFIIKVNPNPTGSISGTISVCQNAANPSVTFSGSSGTAPYIFTYTINGGTNQTITTLSGNSISVNAPTNSLGIYNYNLVNVQDSNVTSCLNTISQMAVVTVNAAPLVSVQPIQTQSICVGGTIQSALTVAYSDGTGTASYQWYSTNSNSTTGGTAVGTNSASYLPPVFTVANTYFYYVVISFSGNGCGNVTSTVAQVTVVNDPLVSSQPIATQTLCENATPTVLSVTATGGIGTFSYQWFMTTSASTTGGNPVGTNSAIFSPLTDVTGTFYYYCAITQSGIGCNTVSNSATVIVNSAPAILIQPNSSTVCETGTISALSFTYTNGVGNPTFQWFSNSVNSNTGGTLISGQTNPTFTPSSVIVGTFYYYCVITFPSLVGSCSSVATNAATIIVNPQGTVSVQPIQTQSICVGGTIQSALTVAYSDGTGTASYQWYSTNSNSTTGGTAVGTNSASYLPPVFTVANTYFYYVVISFSGNGCGNVTSTVAQVTVVNDPLVSSQPIATQTLCENATPTVLSVTATGGIGTFSYQWFMTTSASTTGGNPVGTNSAIFSPLTDVTGTFYYYCAITQSGIGCNTVSNSATVIVNSAPTIQNNPLPDSICLGQTPSLLDVTYNNGTGNAIYQWFSNTSNSNSGGLLLVNENGATFNPPANSVGIFYYYCQITFPSLTGGCEVITSTAASLTINQVPVISNQIVSICSNTVFSVMPYNTSSDIVPIGTTYTWPAPVLNPANSINGSSAEINGQNSISQNLTNTTFNSATATYTITPTSGNCIGQPFTITIIVNPATNANTVVTNITCFGSNNGSLSTNITGGIPFSSGIPYTISWTGPNLFSSISTTILDLQAGVYDLNITDDGNCLFNESYTILEPADIQLSTNLSSNISCFGSNDGSISISVNGGTGIYSYSWTKNGVVFSSSQNINNLAPGTYLVSVTDVNNCGPKTATFIITEPPILAVSLSNQLNVDCFGNSTGTISIIVSGGTPFQTTAGVLTYTYLWSGPNGFISSNQNISNLVAGLYFVTVTDDNGCIKNLTVSLSQPPEIIITATTTAIVCYGDNDATITTTISGGTAPYQIYWDNLATELNQNNLSPGDYTITVTDSNNCVKSLTVTIPSPPIFSVNPIVTNISCFGANDGSIILNFLGGIAPVNLIWSDGSSAGIIRNNLAAGTYSVIITDSKPCTITRTFTILEPQLLILSANLTNALDCNNANSGAINLLVSGGTPPFTYLWNNGTTTEDLVNIPAGNYAITVTDSRGCIKTEQYSITRPNPIVVSVQTTTNADCDNYTVTQKFSAQVTGGVPPYQFNWSSGIVSGNNNEFMTTTQDGLITLTAIDAIGCAAIYSLNVTIPVLGNPTFTTSSIGYVSYGVYSIVDPVQFTSTIPGDYISVLWDFGDGTFSNELNPIHIYSIPNYYLITQTVTYPFGCVYVNQLALTVEKGYLLVVPTAFTPANNDGINDTLRPVTKGLKNIKLDVYDTWGSLIYTEVGDVLIGWNGKIKDIASENGNYYAKVSAETFYGTVINENQTFVLIK